MTSSILPFEYSEEKYKVMLLGEKIKSRFRLFKLCHYEYFEGRRLKKFQSIHQGRRAFIVGNGPSLLASDLTTLAEYGEISFAFNRVFQIFDQTNWRPTYFLSQDQLSLSTSAREIENIECRAKFIPIESHWFEGVDIEGATYFHLKPNNEQDYHLFSDNVSRCVYNSTTVAFSAIQMAVYMGVKEIYLIGTDHHFHVTRDRMGRIHVDPNARDYFADDYNQLRQGEWLPNVDASTMAFMSAKKWAEAHNIRIYNATRGGKLEVFERVDFDSLFS